jgi:hypothetical protein
MAESIGPLGLGFNHDERPCTRKTIPAKVEVRASVRSKPLQSAAEADRRTTLALNSKSSYGTIPYNASLDRYFGNSSILLACLHS